MDATTPIDSQSLLDQGEQLLDSSRQLLAHIDDALGRDPSPGGSAAPASDDDDMVDLTD